VIVSVIWEKPVLLTKREVLSLVVGLIATQDAELLATDTVLSSQVCHERDRHCIRELGFLVSTIVSSWTYESSPEFASKTDGKSKAYGDYLAKSLSHGENRRHLLERLFGSLTKLLDDDSAFTLVQTDHHKLLVDARCRLATLSNPDENPK
jgi:hypothetical protein